VLSTEFDPNKLNFLQTMEMMRKVAELCFLAGYERGTIETLNMMIRSCANVQDFQLIKPIYRVQAYAFAHFRQEGLAI
jgi:hypothetical protein